MGFEVLSFCIVVAFCPLLNKKIQQLFEEEDKLKQHENIECCFSFSFLKKAAEFLYQVFFDD